MVYKAEAVGILLIVALIILFGAPRIGPYAPLGFSVSIGSSMFPELQSGDGVLLVSSRLVSLKPGDIAVYKSGGVFIVHRIMRIEKNTVIFKGDDNVEPDPPVSKSNVYYKVIYKIPFPLWLLTLSTVLTLYGVYLIKIRERQKNGVISLYTLLYFILLGLLAISFSVQSQTMPMTYQVKPNPAVSYSEMSINSTSIMIHFSNLYKYKSILCFVDSRSVPCYMESNTLIIDKSHVLSHNTSYSVEVRITADSPYNVTSILLFSVSEGGIK